MAVAAKRHRPAAQIVRDLMQLYISQNEMPNELTAETILKARRGEELLHAENVAKLFEQLDI